MSSCADDSAEEKGYHNGQEDAAFEYWMKQALDAIRMDVDPWIYELVEQVEGDERQRLIGRIREVLNFYDPASAFKPTPDALRILKKLDEVATTMTQTQLETSTRITRKTIRLIMKRLEERGLVCYPESKRQGATITQKGRVYLPATFDE